MEPCTDWLQCAPNGSQSVQGNNSPEGPCEVKAIFGGARLASYFCLQEQRDGGRTSGAGLSLCNLPAISLFSFPPPLYSELTAQADLTITSRHTFLAPGCENNNKTTNKKTGDCL